MMARAQPALVLAGTWALVGMGWAKGSETPIVTTSTEAPKTVITSRSARVLGKGRSVEFTGDVVLVRGPDRLTADRLVTENDNSFARAWGKVVFVRESGDEPVKWEAWGDRAVYDTGTASGTVWGEGRAARARRTPGASQPVAGGVVDVEAPEISLSRRERADGAPDFAGGLARARGGTYLRSVEEGDPGRVTELWSLTADYDGPSDRFVLEGPYPIFLWGDRPNGPPVQAGVPFARQVEGVEKRELRGERMDLHPAAQRVEVFRRGRADIVFKQRKH